MTNKHLLYNSLCLFVHVLCFANTGCCHPCSFSNWPYVATKYNMMHEEKFCMSQGLDNGQKFINIPYDDIQNFLFYMKNIG